MDLASFIATHPKSARARLVATIAAHLDVTPAAVRHYANGTRLISPLAAVKLEQFSSVIRCDDVRSDVAWVRDRTGNVIAYQIPVQQPEQQVA